MKNNATATVRSAVHRRELVALKQAFKIMRENSLHKNGPAINTKKGTGLNAIFLNDLLNESSQQVFIFAPPEIMHTVLRQLAIADAPGT